MRPLIFTTFLLFTSCTQQTGIEKHVSTLMEKAVGPAVQKGLSDLQSTHGSLSGNVFGIHPGYSAKFEGKWVVGVEGEVEVRAVGIAGSISGTYSGSAQQPAQEPAQEPAPKGGWNLWRGKAH